MFRRRSGALRNREYRRRATDGLRRIEETMKELMMGQIHHHGSFNSDVLSLCNELRQAITVLYDDDYQTEEQEASILDNDYPTLEQHDLRIQARIYAYTLFAVTRHEGDAFTKITQLENSLLRDIEANEQIN